MSLAGFMYCLTNFNPRPPCGGRRSSAGLIWHGANFNPRPPCGGRLSYAGRFNAGCYYFNPRPPCGGRRASCRPNLRMTKSFQPTPSLRRATVKLADEIAAWQQFQPTPSLRRATGETLKQMADRLHFNPRPPCGGRHASMRPAALSIVISTHALLAEGDSSSACLRRIDGVFQPTPSLRRATFSGFNDNISSIFQPTPSLRRATEDMMGDANEKEISTHALLAEGDSLRRLNTAQRKAFQPTPSLRRATTLTECLILRAGNFNPRPPCGGRRQT